MRDRDSHFRFFGVSASRIRGLLAMSAFSSLLAGAAAEAQLVAQDVDYHCTIIASTDEFPEGLPGAPSINAWGRVVFQARVPFPGSVEIRSGDGSVDGMGVPISLPVARSGAPSDPDADFYALSSPVIGDDDRIYWHGYSQIDPGAGSGGGIGLYRKRFDRSLAVEAEAVAVSTATRPPGSIDVEEGATANSTGMILFRGQRLGESIQPELFRGRDASALPVGSTPTEWVMHPGVQPWFAYTSIGFSDYALNVDDGPPLVSVALADRTLHGISLTGEVMPAASFIEGIYDVPGTSWRLRFEDRIAAEVYLDDQLDVTGLTGIPDQSSVNGYGEIALSRRQYGEPLVVADGDSVHRVRCQNAASIPGWFGPEFDLSPRAINHDGQIAFRARTGLPVPSTGADQAYIIRADPLATAHPSSCVGVPDTTPCDDANGATLARCSAGVCEVPEPGFLAQLAIGLLGLARFAGAGRCLRSRPRAGAPAVR